MTAERNHGNFRFRNYDRFMTSQDETMKGSNEDEAIENFDFKPTSRMPFKKKWEHNPEGLNLVINRKSLNVESVRKTDEKIREGNLKFLSKLQNLKPSIDT